MKIKTRNSSKNDGNKIRKVREVLPPVLGLALVVAVLSPGHSWNLCARAGNFSVTIRAHVLVCIRRTCANEDLALAFRKVAVHQLGAYCLLIWPALPCPSPPISSPDHPLQRLMKYLLTALFDQPTTRLLMNYYWGGKDTLMRTHVPKGDAAGKIFTQPARQPASHPASQSVHILFMFT